MLPSSAKSLNHLPSIGADGRFSCPSKVVSLQKRICMDLDHNSFTSMLSSRSVSVRRRISELSDGIAKRFHQIIPSHAGLVINDRTFMMIARHLLDLPASDTIPPACICGYALSENPSHFHSCPMMKGNAITSRHHKCIQVIQKYVHKAGGSFVIEPSDERGKRVDGIIILTDVSLDVSFDFTVVHTSSLSYSSSSTSALLDARAKVKNGKYLHQSASEGRLFLPFVMSSYGVLHQDAIELLWLVADCACTNGLAVNASSFFYSFVDELLVALHCGNAHVANSGLIAARRKHATRTIRRAIAFIEGSVSSSSSPEEFLSAPEESVSPASIAESVGSSAPDSSAFVFIEEFAASSSALVASSSSSYSSSSFSSLSSSSLSSSVVVDCVICRDSFPLLDSVSFGCRCVHPCCSKCAIRHVTTVVSSCPFCRFPVSLISFSGVVIAVDPLVPRYDPDVDEDAAFARSLLENEIV